MADNQKLLVSGAIAGAATPFLLSWAVLPILNFLSGFVPQASLKLAEASAQTVAVDVRGSLTGFEAIGGWLLDALGVTAGNSWMTVVLLGAVGGAILFVVGAKLADALGFLTGTALQKTRNVIFAGSIAAGLVLGTIALPPEIGLTLVNVLIAMLVNAAILAWAYTYLDTKAKLGLVAF